MIARIHYTTLLFSSLILGASVHSYAIERVQQNPTYLEVEIDDIGHGKILFRYKEGLADLIVKRTDGPEDPWPVVEVARVSLSEGQPKDLLIEYHQGPSWDPMFIIYRLAPDGTRTQLTFAGQYPTGLIAELPGDGALYTRGHVNEYFDKRKKYTFQDRLFRELLQTTYYVGLESEALVDLYLLNRDTHKSSAVIRAGEPVSVLVNQGDWYLLKDRHDITGWWRPTRTGQQAVEIKDFYFAGV
jgi:hypothetical protein